MTISVILLAGGVGTRMGSLTPKQYLPLKGKPLALYSFDLFQKMDAIGEVIVVCDPAYQKLFQKKDSKPLKFALPGVRRQDSVWNGLQKLSASSEIVCVHDSARPIISESLALNVISAAKEFGAATAAVSVKFTVKEGGEEGFVSQTLDRSRLWEIQTPQAAKREYFEEGFALVNNKKITVTDDVSLAELLHKKVKLVEASYSNIKITTPEDLRFAEFLMGH